MDLGSLPLVAKTTDYRLGLGLGLGQHYCDPANSMM